MNRVAAEKSVAAALARVRAASLDRTLRTVARTLLERNATSLAKDVYAVGIGLSILDSEEERENAPLLDMLKWTGFDEIMKRDNGVAEHIYDTRIVPQDRYEGAQGY